MYQATATISSVFRANDPQRQAGKGFTTKRPFNISIESRDGKDDGACTPSSNNNASISLTPLPEGYSDWLTDLKGRIHSVQQRATLSVNRELVMLYWQIGRDILSRQAQQG